MESKHQINNNQNSGDNLTFSSTGQSINTKLILESRQSIMHCGLTFKRPDNRSSHRITEAAETISLEPVDQD